MTKSNPDWYSYPKGRMYCVKHNHFFSVGEVCDKCVSISPRLENSVTNPNNPKFPVLPVENVEKVKKEVSSNRISLGSTSVSSKVLTYYCPHNCRVYYLFNKEGFNHKNRYDNIGCSYELVNSTEHLFKNFKGFNVCIKKNFVEIRPLNPKWYDIEFDKPELVEFKKLQIQNELLNRCTDVLRSFISVFGGSSDFNIHHFRILERKFMGDKITDKIPKPIMFRNEVVKKLYNEKNLEYSDGISDVNDVAFHDNYTRNLGLYDYAPNIAKELEVIRISQVEFSKQIQDELIGKALNPLTSQIQLHLAVMKDIKDNIGIMRKLAQKGQETPKKCVQIFGLSKKDKKKLEVL